MTKETGRNNILLISLVAIFCGLGTFSFLFTGMDVVIIAFTCILALWTGIRESRADLWQMYRGWGIGAVVSVTPIASISLGCLFL